MPYKDKNSPKALAFRQKHNEKKRETRRLFRLNHPIVYIPKRFCKQGHDTTITGRRNNGCIKCLRYRSAQWNINNIDRKRDSIYRKYYGLSLEDCNRLLEKQNFSCAICGISQTKLIKRLNVDHCHVTGKVRGLLCWDCNKRLGWIENKEFCLKASIYLQGAL